MISGFQMKKVVAKARWAAGKKQILLACMPKSGSTFISNKLSSPSGFLKVNYSNGYHRNEQEINEFILLGQMMANPNKNLVSQMHVRLSQPTYDIICRQQVQTIVLRRKLKDALLSMSEFIFDPAHAVCSTAFLDEDVIDSVHASGISPLEFTTRMSGPWYINFHLSWQKMMHFFPEELMPICIQYEDFFGDPRKGLDSLFNRLGFSGIDAGEALDDSRPTLLNKGVCGRGQSAYDDDKAAAKAFDWLIGAYKGSDLDVLL